MSKNPKFFNLKRSNLLPSSPMRTKRARVFRSPSNGEFGLLNQLKPIDSLVVPSKKKRAVAPATATHPKPVPMPVERMKSKMVVDAKVPEYSRRSMFTLGSSSGLEDKEDERAWVFPLSCSLCKKVIQENEDVFMYGYLRPFCSTECRTIQIELDEKDRKPSPEPNYIQLAALYRKYRNPPPAAFVATQPKQEPARQVYGSPNHSQIQVVFY